MIPEINLAKLAQEELDKEEENLAFKEVLLNRDAGEVDALVNSLNAEIAPQIDCTQCGNCCKSLMVNITPAEVVDLSGYLKMPEEELKAKYIETSEGGKMIINTIPCYFLKGTSCSIYEHRFAECRNFPGLHNKGFNNRLFATFMHYGRCPIIYNVIEELKIKTGFIVKG
ncbi:MAG TPA: YkgJ family cysteine cluster protein [Chitinophagaceae bacterium]|nr:YkgJ family cysteine cluster protein [Chitinophagaceae bacterium]